MRVRLGVLAVLVLAVSAGGADDDGRLTVRRIWEGSPLAKALPEWAWRPGHGDLVRRKGDGDQKALVALDPRTGEERELLRLASLAELVPGDATPMRGIGRGGPPETLWSATGDQVLVPVKGDLVWVDLAAGTKRRLTSTKAPLSDVRLSPDGARVSFSRANDLWVVPTAGGEEVRLTEDGSEERLHATLDWVYPEELGFDTAAWWSPDSRRIAFLTLDETGVGRFPLPSSVARLGSVEWVRYPKAGEKNPVARVGVVSATGGATTWLDLGTPAPEYVARVAWFPGGTRVAVATLDRAQRRLRLLACDAATGASTQILEETDPAWVDVPPAPRFFDDRRLLWRSRRDDATRWWLVALSADGGPPVQVPVTSADVEADELLDVDTAKEAVLFEGTARGALHGSVFASGAATERAVRAPFLGDADGQVRASLQPTSRGTERLVLVTVSRATVPPRREVRDVRDGTLVRALGDATTRALSAIRLPATEYGELETPEGRLPWRLWKPADLDETRRYPVIVQVYGGPASRMVRDDWERGPFLETLLVQHGFLVFEVDGRGTAGRGARFERLVQGRLGLPELEDQVRGVEMLRKRPYVDGARVGIWGWSYGGTMVCNALCRRPDVFQAGFAVAPVTDWRNYDTIYTERYMGTPQENAKGYDDTSCVKAAATMDGHLFLAHGLGDDNVHVQNTFQLVDALMRAQKTGFELMVYPDAGHGLGGRHVDVFERLLRWFETCLR